MSPHVFQALLNRRLSVTLQQQLLDCLTAATQAQRLISELTLERAEEILVAASSESDPKSSAPQLFAVGVFFRWVLRCAAAQPLPLPCGSKAGIHADSGLPLQNNVNSVGNGNSSDQQQQQQQQQQQNQILQWLGSLVHLALKVLHVMLDDDDVDSEIEPTRATRILLPRLIPTASAVRMVGNVVTMTTDKG